MKGKNLQGLFRNSSIASQNHNCISCRIRKLSHFSKTSLTPFVLFVYSFYNKEHMALIFCGTLRQNDRDMEIRKKQKQKNIKCQQKEKKESYDIQKLLGYEIAYR